MPGFLEWLQSPEAMGLAAGLAGTTQRGFGPAIAGGLMGMQQGRQNEVRRRLYEGQLSQLEQQQAEAKRKEEARTKMAAFLRGGAPGDSFEQDRAVRVASADPNAAIPTMPKRTSFMNLPPELTEAAALSDNPLGTALQLAQATQKTTAPIKGAPGEQFLDPNTMQPLYTVPAKPDADPEYLRLMRAAGVDPGSPQGRTMLNEYLQRKGQGQQIVFPPGPRAGEVEAYKSANTFGDETQKAGLEARTNLGRVRLMGSTLDRIPNTGIGTETKMQIANIGQSLFGTKLDPNLPEKELFQQLSTQLQINAAPKGQGQVSNYERDLFAKAVPNMATSKDGIRKALGYYQKIHEKDIGAAEIVQRHREKNGGIINPATIYKELADYAAKSVFTDDDIADLGRASGGGGAPAGPVVNNPGNPKRFNYVPGQGLVPQ